MSSGRLIHPALECVSCCLWYWHGTAEVRGPEFASEQGVGGGRNDGRGTVLRQCWLCREPCVRWRHRMLQGPGPKGGRDRWLWAIRNVTCLKCKAWSNDPFKVQADHMDWENYGTEGVKRLKGFSCYSESEKHSVAPKENHTKMVAKSIATGNQGRWLLSTWWGLLSKLWMGPLLYSGFLFLHQEPRWVGSREKAPFTSLLTTFWIVTNELQIV